MRLLVPTLFCAALGAAVLLLLEPMQILQWDNLVHNLPLTLEAWRQLAAGKLPAWNPYLWSGSPLLADPQSQALYPVTWAAYTIAGERPEGAPHVMFALHVAIASGGAYALARALGATLAGGLVAGAVYALDPFMAYLASSFANELAVLAWLPWAACAALRAADGPTPVRWLAAGAAFAALSWAAGYPQLWAYGAIVIVVLTTGAARRWTRGLVCGALVPLGGLALSLHQLLSFVALWRTSQRAELQTLDEFLRTDVPVASWPAILLPGVLGAMRNSLPLVINNWPYLGLATVTLALIAVLRPDRKRATLLAIALGALWLAGGRSAGLLPILYDAVPGIGLIRGPYKFFASTAFAAAMLAGLGASDVERGPRPWHAALLLAACALAVASFLDPDEVLPALWIAAGRVPTLALAAGVGGALVLAVLILLARRGGRARAWLPAAAVAAAVLGFVPDLSIYARPAPLPQELGPLPGPMRQATTLLGGTDRWHWAVSALHGRLSPDLRRALGVYRRLEMTTGYSAFLDVGYASAIGLDAATMPLESSGQPPAITARNRVLDVLSARHVLTKLDAGFAQWLARQRDADGMPVYGQPIAIDELMLLLRHTALPRVRAVREVASAPSREGAIEALQSGELDPRSVALLELPPDRLPAVGGSCRLGRARRAAGRVDAEVQCRTPGFLVFSERHDPGWRATVDDVPAPLLRAYGLVLGVPVPEGKHRVVVRYEPLGFAPGLVASGLLALALVAGAVVEARRARSARGASAARDQPAAGVAAASGGSQPPPSAL